MKDGRDLLIDLPFVLVTALSFISHQSSVILDGERRVIHKESNHTLAPCGFDGETRARIEFMANLGDPTPDALRRRRAWSGLSLIISDTGALRPSSPCTPAPEFMLTVLTSAWAWGGAPCAPSTQRVQPQVWLFFWQLRTVQLPPCGRYKKS